MAGESRERRGPERLHWDFFEKNFGGPSKLRANAFAAKHVFAWESPQPTTKKTDLV
jgi:hypothetical protein